MAVKYVGMTEVPEDLAEALKAAGLAEFFAGCTEAHRREYLKWMGEAKRPATRSDRIARAVTMIAAKQRAESARRSKKS